MIAAPTVDLPAIDVGVYVGFILTCMTVGALVWRPVRTRIKRSDQFHEDWFGEPDREGVKGRDGVMRRLQTLEERLNGDGLGGQVSALAAQLQDHHAAAVEIAATQTAMADRQAEHQAQADARYAGLTQDIADLHGTTVERAREAARLAGLAAAAVSRVEQQVEELDVKVSEQLAEAREREVALRAVIDHWCEAG